VPCHHASLLAPKWSAYGMVRPCSPRPRSRLPKGRAQKASNGTPTFSKHSYGFRPWRSVHQAEAQAQRYIVAGYSWVVDFDLEKLFDRVNHDKLVGQIAKRVEDKRPLKLIRAFLNAGVMENVLVSPSVEGTPQGGPLSPLVSNLVLDELDRELERRGHRFVRYADDCNIYVRSERAGQRVMKSITHFITYKLKVNESKSAVARPQERKFLGFSFTTGPDVASCRSMQIGAMQRFATQQEAEAEPDQEADRTNPHASTGSATVCWKSSADVVELAV